MGKTVSPFFSAVFNPLILADNEDMHLSLVELSKFDQIKPLTTE